MKSQKDDGTGRKLTKLERTKGILTAVENGVLSLQSNDNAILEISRERFEFDKEQAQLAHQRFLFDQEQARLAHERFLIESRRAEDEALRAQKRHDDMQEIILAALRNRNTN